MNVNEETIKRMHNGIESMNSITDNAKIIHNATVQLFANYINKKGDIQNSLYEYIESLNGIINEDYHTIMMNCILSIDQELFNMLADVLNHPFTYLYSNKGVHEMRETTFTQMLCEIAPYHTHTVEKQRTYKCIFHQESLFTHLHLAMLITLAKLPNEYTNNQKLMYMTIALLHDIGKYRTVGLAYNHHEAWTKFPFHGEMGSGILAMACTTGDYSKWFTYDQQTIMMRTISTHMCGYHETDPNSIEAKYKWDLLRIETPEVKECLYYLSFGDHYGAIRDIKLHNVNEDHEFENSREIFYNEIQKPFNFTSFKVNNHKDGVVFVVRGMSASGKTTFIRQLKAYVTQPIVHVERDQIMCEIIAETMNETCTEKAVGELYARYINVYNSNKRVYAPLVNGRMLQRIDEALKNQDIVIVDTVMSLFKSFKSIISKRMQNAFCIAIDIIRTKPITQSDADRMGCDVQLQIDIHGKRDNFYWLPDDTQDNCRDLSSLSTANKISIVHEFRPNLTHQITWTHGIEMLFKQLDQLIKTTTNQNPNTDSNDTSIDEITNMMSNVKIDIDQMGIVEYMNYLYKKHGRENAINAIKVQGFNIDVPYQFKNTEYKNRIIKIKYDELTQLWTTWARECRGVVLFLDDDDNWVQIKYQLQRGAEILTGLHVKNGIDSTETYNMTNFDHYHPNQRMTITKLLNREMIDGVMTFKLDGSLLGISLYSGKYRNIISNMLKVANDPLAMLLHNYAIENNTRFIPVLSTQGTFILGNEMTDYMITAIISSIDSNNINELAGKLSPLELFALYLPKFFEMLIKFYNNFTGNYGDQEIITISCEAICKNRSSAWVNIAPEAKVHTELTVAYKRSVIKILGLSYGDKNPVYLPHFVFSSIIHEAGFSEPLWWRIESSVQIEQMFEQLSITIRSKNRREAEKEFLQKFKPNNEYSNINDHNDSEFDYEGFVFYTLIPNINGTIYDYSKIKTEEYYKSHKLRDSNVPYLHELGEYASDIFPIAKLIREFYTNCNDYLFQLMTKIYDMLKSGVLVDSMEDKAKNSYMKQNHTTRMRMLVNVSKNWPQSAREIFNTIFPSLANIVVQDRNEEISSIIKNLTMELKPWDSDIEMRITKMIDTKHRLINQLFHQLNCSNA